MRNDAGMARDADWTWWSGDTGECGWAVLSNDVQASYVSDDGSVVDAIEPAGSIVWLTEQWEDAETVLIHGAKIGLYYVTTDFLCIVA